DYYCSSYTTSSTVFF
nr:immunoglobulin light chain junction region [Macaca mulatta]